MRNIVLAAILSLLPAMAMAANDHQPVGRDHPGYESRHPDHGFANTPAGIQGAIDGLRGCLTGGGYSTQKDQKIGAAIDKLKAACPTCH